MIKTAVTLGIFFITVFTFGQSNVVGASSFDAGKIIDDSIFTDSSSLSPSQIQQFLVSKVPVCDTNGTQTSEYGGGTRAQWGAANYGQSTFICLKDYSEGGKFASQIIFDAAQEFQISPKVLIVLLQKEQGLVTDTWPLNIQYRSATGYGCPDTAACDSQYYGLTNQIRWAARMFRAIMNASPNWYTPYVVGNNFIRYSPDSSCGGSNVTIQNRSTQALYNYTPYQPNAGAIAAGWGQAPCGAYGNRNFHLYYTDWFGSTNAQPTYNWESAGQQVTINGITTSTNGINITPGSSAKAIIKAKNTSNQTWYQYNTLLGTARPNDRTSVFTSSDWVAPNRPSSLKEASVLPGAVGTFEFTVTAPNKLMSSREYFNIVTEGRSWHADIGYYYDVSVIQPTGEYYNVSLQSSNLYTDAARTNNISRSYNNVVLGSTLYGEVKFTNTGNNNLDKSTALLGTTTPRDRTSPFQDPTWINSTRPARIAADSVAAGQTGSVLFSLKTPTQTGTYTEAYGMVVEGKTWVDSDKATFVVHVVGQPRTALYSNNSLVPGSQLTSSTLKHKLLLQSDGNLVLYNGTTPLWSSNTVGAKSPQLILQNDGNLVLYSEGGRAVWSSGTFGNQRTLVRLQDDGNLVIYNENNTPRWSTGTNGR